MKLVIYVDVKQINIITLAYLGDSVYELFIREHLINKGIAKVDNLQRQAIKYVSAKNQARILDYLIDNNYLTGEELEIVKRGRNYSRETHPKNTDVITYKMSSGFEALIGYLYFEDKKNRLDEIMNIVLEEYYEKNS